MYEMIRDIEVTLHSAIKKALQDGYGDSGEKWWRKGIPQKINEECASAWARDEEPADEPYRYTTFIHLKEIFAKEWAILKKLVPEDMASNKNDLLSKLGKVNQIRNSVMHPVKGKTLTEEDFAFVREFQGQLDLERLKFFINAGRFPSTWEKVGR